MLRSQRFRPNATLKSCVDSGHRIHAGERDADAVSRLQSALLDLGYTIPGGADGIFGDASGDAVVRFKTDEALQPNDPVAARGTIGRLDEYFAHEPEDPDAPDPSAEGLTELAREAMTLARSWIEVAIRDLETYTTSTGGDLDEVQVDAEASFHLSDLNEPFRGVPEFILPTYRRAARLLDPGNDVIQLVPVDRFGWAGEFQGRADYRPMKRRIGARWIIAPPFRNALSPEERAVDTLRFAVVDEGAVDVLAIPNSPRSMGLVGNEGVRNELGYASFAYRRATGGDMVWRPRYTWIRR